MKISERLRQRIKNDLGIDVELPVRIPRGWHGRCAGQWAWQAKLIGFAGDIGSEDTMTECVNAPRISTYRELRPAGSIIVNAEWDAARGGE